MGIAKDSLSTVTMERVNGEAIIWLDLIPIIKEDHPLAMKLIFKGSSA